MYMCMTVVGMWKWKSEEINRLRESWSCRKGKRSPWSHKIFSWEMFRKHRRLYDFLKLPVREKREPRDPIKYPRQCLLSRLPALGPLPSQKAKAVIFTFSQAQIPIFIWCTILCMCQKSHLNDCQHPITIFSRVGVIGSCEPFNMGVETWTQLLCERDMYSLPLNYLFSASSFIYLKQNHYILNFHKIYIFVCE